MMINQLVDPKTGVLGDDFIYLLFFFFRDKKKRGSYFIFIIFERGGQR